MQAGDREHTPPAGQQIHDAERPAQGHKCAVRAFVPGASKSSRGRRPGRSPSRTLKPWVVLPINPAIKSTVASLSCATVEEPS